MRDTKAPSAYIRVNLNDNEAFDSIQIWQIEEAEAAMEAGEQDGDEDNSNFMGGSQNNDGEGYYKQSFINMNPLYRKHYLLEASAPTSGNGDFFYFNLCKPSEVSDLMLINAHIDPFLTILDNPARTLYSQHFIEKAESALLNLLLWLSNVAVQEKVKPSLADMNQPPSHPKQNIFRETGLIEILISIIQLIYNENLLSSSSINDYPFIFSFVQTLLKLLTNICHKVPIYYCSLSLSLHIISDLSN